MSTGNVRMVRLLVPDGWFEYLLGHGMVRKTTTWWSEVEMPYCALKVYWRMARLG